MNTILYKMALLDIDGTLVTTWKSITKQTKNVIKRISDNGVIICLCTGRNVNSTIPVHRALRLSTPCMCVDGMVMYDVARRSAIFENALPHGVMSDVLDIVAQYDVNVEVITDKRYYWYVKNKNIRGYDFYTQDNNSLLIKLGSIPYKIWFGVRNIKNLQLVKTKGEKIYEVVAIGAPDQTDAVKAALGGITTTHGCEVLTRLLWSNQLFITAKDVGKSHGLRILCEHFNIKPSEVVAIGDDDNDIDMLKSAGMGVAMGNASDAVKNSADFVTRTNNNEGAAFALEEFFL
ncbi:MAG: Cof-type HAD-IIB family hydrolase [Clostridiales bacterium]|nr:Cof-type HAD-IIB family hydrolase [Clostridiales bacterium]